MLSKKPVLFMAALLSAALVVAPSPTQKAGWKGKITSEDGVRIVANPADPLYGVLELDIMEDLRIGKEGDERTQFYRVRDVAVDPRGNIYVDDMSNGRVQVFDPRGAFLRTIGGPGQGPSEFEYPTLIRFGGSQGHTHIMDRFGRINLFDGQGIHVRSVVPESGFDDFFPDPAGGFVVVMETVSEKELTSLHALKRLDAAGRTRAVLAEFPFTVYMERREGGTLTVSTGYEMSLYAAPLPSNAIVYGYSEDYEIVVLGPDDTKSFVIRKDEPRPEFTSAEKAGFGRVPVPKLRPYFFGILTDPVGRIYVQRNMNTTGKRGYGPIATEAKRFDVFSSDGIFLFRAALPPNTRVIGDGFAYSYFVDEDQGLEFAQRFRIKNYANLPLK